MRKIFSKEKEARNQTILGIVLVIVMFGSVFGVVLNGFGSNNNSDDRIAYRGIQFIKNNDYWFANIRGLDFVLRYNPKEINYTESEIENIENYVGEPLYIYSEDEVSEIEIYRNLEAITQKIQGACFDEEKCEDDLPIKTCEENFIIIQESDKEEILQNESCVYISGKKEDLIKLTDEFLFKILEIY